MTMSERVYHWVNGALVPKPGNQRDPDRRYGSSMDVTTGETKIIEFTEAEEAEWNAKEQQWKEDQPKRDAEAAKTKAANEAYRASLSYEPRIVAYVDVLGWSDAIKRSINDPELVRVLGSGLTVVEGHVRLRSWVHEHIGRSKDSAGTEMAQFSDSIIISTRPTRGGIAELIGILHSLTWAFLSNGMLVRGGIAKGLMYHKDAIAYGPALVEAHLLESEPKGLPPRILLSEELSVLFGLGQSVASRAGVPLGHFKTWRKDEDGRSFLDFLQPLNANTFDPALFEDGVSTWLATLRKPIEKGLQTYLGNEGIERKYRWLAEYFNAVAAEYPRVGVPRIPLASKAKS